LIDKPNLIKLVRAVNSGLSCFDSK